MQTTQKQKGDATMGTMTKERDTATTKRSGARKNSKTYYSTSYTRSARSAGYKVEKLDMADYTEYWLITPELATEILATCENNRKIKPGRVGQYYHDMITGAWKPEGNEIALDPDGNLLDGQHRLTAIVDFGKPIPVRVHLNVPKDTPFDIGAGRSSADALKMQGEVDTDLTTNCYIAMVNAIFRIVLHQSVLKKVTNADRRDLFWQYGEDLRFVMQAVGSHNMPCSKAGVEAGLFAALRAGVSPKEIIAFADLVNNGTGVISDKDAAIVLRTALLKNTYGNRGGNSIMQLAWATEQALADHMANRPRSQVYRPSDGCYSKKLKKEFDEWYSET